MNGPSDPTIGMLYPSEQRQQQQQQQSEGQLRSASDPRLNVIDCGDNDEDEELLNRWFDLFSPIQCVIIFGSGSDHGGSGHGGSSLGGSFRDMNHNPHHQHVVLDQKNNLDDELAARYRRGGKSNNHNRNLYQTLNNNREVNDIPSIIAAAIQGVRDDPNDDDIAAIVAAANVLKASQTATNREVDEIASIIATAIQGICDDPDDDDIAAIVAAAHVLKASQTTSRHDGRIWGNTNNNHPIPMLQRSGRDPSLRLNEGGSSNEPGINSRRRQTGTNNNQPIPTLQRSGRDPSLRLNEGGSSNEPGINGRRRQTGTSNYGVGGGGVSSSGNGFKSVQTSKSHSFRSSKSKRSVSGSDLLRRMTTNI